MRLVIEINEDMTDDNLRRILRDAQWRQKNEQLDHWIDLETPFTCLNVSDVVGVFVRGEVDEL